MAADLITLIEGAVRSKFVGPAAGYYGKVKLARLQQLGDTAQQLLTRVGRVHRSVGADFLLPLAQAASLATDPNLASKWAALLANAADPVQRVEVQPVYTEVLRQLTPADALALDALYCSPVTAPRPATEHLGSTVVMQLRSKSGFSFSETSMCIDNLVRLHLCTIPAAGRLVFSGVHFSTPGQVTTSTFGQQFLAACTPPVA